jgi:hypothetical protein
VDPPAATELRPCRGRIQVAPALGDDERDLVEALRVALGNGARV